MVKGNICEKCQKNEATIPYDIQGWRKWMVCDECCKELQLCAKCKKNKATHLIEENKEKKQVCADCANSEPDNSDNEIKEFEQKWEKCLITSHAPQGNQAIEKIVTVAWCQENKKILEPYLQKLDIVKKSFPKGGMCWQYFFDKSTQDENYLKEVVNKTIEEAFGKRMREINDKEKSGIDYMWVFGHHLIDFSIKDQKLALQSYLRALDIKEKQLTGKWKPQEPSKEIPNKDKNKPNIPDKKEPSEDKPKPDEICERCKASCKKLISDDKVKGERTYKITFKRITHYYTDFRKEVHHFGTDCPCAEEFKKEHQQSCSKCNKTEWPDLNKGWVLDYEIHKAFCSPLCHVTYRQMKWEEAQRLTQVELFSPELKISANEGQKIDWEQKGLKELVLFWRTYAKELEQKLNSQSLTPQEIQQANYLRNLQQNTLRRAEDNYRSRYGELTEDDPNKGKGLSGGMIALIVIGIAIVVGGIIVLLTRNKNKKIK